MKYEQPEIILPDWIIEQYRASIDRMLEISARAGCEGLGRRAGHPLWLPGDGVIAVQLRRVASSENAPNFQGTVRATFSVSSPNGTCVNTELRSSLVVDHCPSFNLKPV